MACAGFKGCLEIWEGHTLGILPVTAGGGVGEGGRVNGGGGSDHNESESESESENYKSEPEK